MSSVWVGVLAVERIARVLAHFHGSRRESGGVEEEQATTQRVSTPVMTLITSSA